MALAMLNQDEGGNLKFYSSLVVQYVYLSILIKTLKPDQGVLHSIGHVRFISTEIGRYLQNIDNVSKFLRLCCLFLSGKTCAELKRQMKRPDTVARM